MIRFAVATDPPKVQNKALVVVSYGLALWTIAMAVAQMVSFEEFSEVMQALGTVGYSTALAIAMVVITLEVFSVPFLLRLRLSPAARFVSSLFALLLPFVWMFLVSLPLMNNESVASVGYFGAFVAVSVELALVVSALWVIVVGLTFGGLGGQKALSTSRK